MVVGLFSILVNIAHAASAVVVVVIVFDDVSVGIAVVATASSIAFVDLNFESCIFLAASTRLFNSMWLETIQ